MSRLFKIPPSYDPATLNALLPSQAGMRGRPFRTDGVNTFWSDGEGDDYLLNGEWEFNQAANYPFTFPPATPYGAYLPSDLWDLGTNVPVNTMTFSLQTPGDCPAGTVNVLRCARVVGVVVGNNRYVQFSHNVTSEETRRFWGRTITFSAYFRLGAAYVAEPTAFIGVRFHTGTGVDQSLDITGFTGVLVPAQTFGNQTSGWFRLACTMTVPTTANQIAFSIYLEPDELNLAGVANQYFEIGGPQIDFGAHPLPYRHYSQATMLEVCQRRYFKTFPRATAPAAGLGPGLGAYMFAQPVAGAVVANGPHFPYPTRMRAAPIITQYSPAGAGAFFFDFTIGAACGAALVGVGEESVQFSPVGAVGSGAGDQLGVHFTADARI